jgi:hypothetical protein
MNACLPSSLSFYPELVEGKERAGERLPIPLYLSLFPSTKLRISNREYRLLI